MTRLPKMQEVSTPDLSGSGEGPAAAPPGSGPVAGPLFMDERGPMTFRRVFGEMLSRSRTLETAIHRIRLGAVDLSAREVSGLERLRILVAEVNARTVEEEAYGLGVDQEREESLARIVDLLRGERLEIRSAPLGGWSPDFSVFSGPHGPEAVLLGLHWFRRPFPHRGPAWAACFGPPEALRAHARFQQIWEEAHHIGPAILRLLERSLRGAPVSMELHPPSR